MDAELGLQVRTPMLLAASWMKRDVDSSLDTKQDALWMCMLMLCHAIYSDINVRRSAILMSRILSCLISFVHQEQPLA